MLARCSPAGALIFGSVTASPVAGDQGTGVRTDTQRNKLLCSGSRVSKFQLACRPLSRNTSNVAEWADSTSLSMTWDTAEASSILQRGCWRGKLRRRVWYSGGRSLPGVFQEPTSWCSLAANNCRGSNKSDSLTCLKPTGAARKDSSSMRSGSPPGCRDCESECARDLVRSVVARFGSR